MATIGNDTGGRKRILFVAPGDGKRRTIRLGKVSAKQANAFKVKVEALIGQTITGVVNDEVSRWLRDLDDQTHAKLAAVGLVNPREPAERLTVATFTADWLAGKKEAGYKPDSLRAWGQTAAELATLFGERALSSIAHADGEAYRSAMQARGLRAATVHRRLGHGRQMLEDAVRFGHIAVNPWRHVRVRAGDMSERRAYVPIGDAERVIEHCPNVWWRLLVALARFAGLRVPSEAFSLKWTDVDWERGRLTVPSPKTERCGKAHRVIPLFPMLRPHLEAAFDQAAEGAVYVFPDEYRRRASGADGWGGANLRTTLTKICRRAAVEPWPRVWHSLRASCESDLAQSFPLATVTKWLGNTPSVALRHYVDPTEAAFTTAQTWTPPKSAAQRGTESGTVTGEQGLSAVDSVPSETQETPCFQGATTADNHRQTYLRECMGIEPTASFVQTRHWF